MDRIIEEDMEKQTILEEIARVPFWWHSIDLGEGVVTKGHKTQEILSNELKMMQLPDLKGKTVLDIGAWDGFFSFEAERRGAKRVLSLDHFSWSLDIPAHLQYGQECQKKGISAHADHEKMFYWHPDTLPGKKGFNTAHKILNSNVESLVKDYMTVEPQTIGTFDIVFYFGVLYHMENPLAALRKVSSLTGERMILETQAIHIPGFEDVELVQFYESDELNRDPTNWWSPNEKALIGMCRAAGFKSVEVMLGPPNPPMLYTIKQNLWELYGSLGFQKTAKPAPVVLPNTDKLVHYRAIVHAWK